jgi:hypothetical protein
VQGLVEAFVLALGCGFVGFARDRFGASGLEELDQRATMTAPAMIDLLLGAREEAVTAPLGESSGHVATACRILMSGWDLLMNSSKPAAQVSTRS